MLILLTPHVSTNAQILPATQLIGPILKKLADDSIPLAATSSSHLDTGPSSSRCSTSPPTTPPEFKNVKLPHNVIVVDGSMDFSKPLGKVSAQFKLRCCKSSLFVTRSDMLKQAGRAQVGIPCTAFIVGRDFNSTE